MKRGMWMLMVVGCLAALIVLVAASPDRKASDQQKIASLVTDMNRLGPSGLADLQPIPIRRFELPDPGVDVMRARLHESYTVDGVGSDNVELTGWIAVRHSKPYLAQGQTDLKWGTAVVDTEFVAMDLHGKSDVFGPVNVTLDKERPVFGQVGRIELPEFARLKLMARLEKNDAAPEMRAGRVQEKAIEKKAPAAKTDAGAAKAKATAVTPQPQPAAVDAVCIAAVNVGVDMPDLKLHMKTEHQVYWYSLVDTIPPVGHTASVAVEPVRLVANGRAVATLQSGVVDFREVVRHVRLSSDGIVMAFKR